MEKYKKLKSLKFFLRYASELSIVPKAQNVSLQLSSVLNMGASCSLDHISWLVYFQLFQENSAISRTELLGEKEKRTFGPERQLLRAIEQDK